MVDGIEKGSGVPPESLGEQNNASESKGESGQAEDNADLPIPALPKESGISAPPAHDQASQNHQNGSDSPANRSVAASTKTIAGLTIILAIASVASILTSLLQWNVTRSQLDVMQADERAWLYMEVDVVGAKELSEKSVLSLPLKLSIDNTGKLPARDVAVTVIITAGYSESRDQMIDISRTCDQADNMTEIGEGDVIFPGKKVTPHIVSFENDGIVSRKESFHSAMFMYACVSYFVDGSDRRGHTTVVKEIDIVQMLSETPSLRASVEAKPVFMLQRQRLD